jgi:hypothetical protein
VTSILGPGQTIGVHGPEVWFVIGPGVGIETDPPSAQEALIVSLTDRLDAHPVAVGNGIWSYVYRPPAGTTQMVLPGLPTSLPAWLFRSTSGKVITSGPTPGWRVTGPGRPGYLVWGDYWTPRPGRATATAVLSGHGPADVEVWDVARNDLVARRQVVLTGAEKVTAQIPFAVPPPSHQVAFEGFGPFQSRPVAPSADQLEVRVFTPAGTEATAFSVGVS